MIPVYSTRIEKHSSENKRTSWESFDIPENPAQNQIDHQEI